jgi:Spy/CpxP family protein refolding chaperone
VDDEVNMKNFLKHKVSTLLVVGFVPLLVSGGYARAAAQEQQPSQVRQQLQVQQQPPAEDPIRELNLTPEQRERIRSIREQHKEERFVINQRLREANLELERVLDSDNPDESLVEQRLRDVAAAQAASMRMRVLSEVRIRRVLTAEQLSTLRLLRQNAREFRRQRQMENRDDGRRRESIERQRKLQKQRNGLAPLFPRRGDGQSTVRP